MKNGSGALQLLIWVGIEALFYKATIMRALSDIVTQHASRKYLGTGCGKDDLSPANDLPHRSMREIIQQKFR
jgi:hypothetical protein